MYSVAVQISIENTHIHQPMIRHKNRTFRRLCITTRCSVPAHNLDDLSAIVEYTLDVVSIGEGTWGIQLGQVLDMHELS